MTASPTAQRRKLGSGFLRGLDPRIPSNLAVLSGGATAGIISGIRLFLRPETPVNVVTGAVTAGVSVFLVWAIVRELDPDHPLTAVLALVPAIGAAVAGPVSLVLPWLVLVAVRTVVRPAGRLTFLDWAAIPVFGGVAAMSAGGVAASFAVAVALVVDALSESPPQLGQLIATAAIVIAAIAVALMPMGQHISATAPTDVALALAIAIATVVVALAAAALPAEKLRSKNDAGSSVLSPARMVNARRVVAGLVGGVLITTPVMDQPYIWPLLIGVGFGSAGAIVTFVRSLR